MNQAPQASAATPAPSRFETLTALCAGGASALYLLNLTMGIEFLPDVLPLVGNLDEAGATALLLHSLNVLRRARAARR